MPWDRVGFKWQPIGKDILGQMNEGRPTPDASS
jgi:hypothetical protein